MWYSCNISRTPASAPSGILDWSARRADSLHAQIRRRRPARRRLHKNPCAKRSLVSCAPVRSCGWRALHILRALLPSGESEIYRYDHDHAPRPAWLCLALLLMFGQRLELRNPRSRRTPPDLPPRRELVALAQNAHTQHIERLHPITRGGRIKWRTALAAKCLHARSAALGGGLDIGLGLPVHFQRFARHRQRNTKRGTCCSLTIGAVTHLRSFRIGLGLDSDCAAGACAVYFHCIAPLDCSAALSMASISASERPK